MMRTPKGLTLTELVVSSVLMGFTLAAIGELVVLNTFASTKLTNKVDGQLGCSRAVRRITEDVRHSKLIGNNFSTVQKNVFPDTSSGIDIFSSTVPAGGWPQTPWNPPPYVLGPRTLILQQPVLFDDGTDFNPLNGFPLKTVNNSVSTGVPAQTIECLDTVIYQILPDPDHTDMFVLQLIRIPGKSSVSGAKLKPVINPPQTLLTGIVGPIDPNATGAGPCVFEYLRSPADTTAVKVPTTADVSSLRGVSINIEAQVPNSKEGRNLEITASHAEAFIRSSKYLKLVSDGNN